MSFKLKYFFLIFLSFTCLNCETNYDIKEFKYSLLNYHISDIKKERPLALISLNKARSFFIEEDKETLIIPPIIPNITYETWEESKVNFNLTDVNWFFEEIQNQNTNLKPEWKEKYGMEVVTVFSEIYYDSSEQKYSFYIFPLSPYITCGPNYEYYEYKYLNDEWAKLKID